MIDLGQAPSQQPENLAGQYIKNAATSVLVDEAFSALEPRLFPEKVRTSILTKSRGPLTKILRLEDGLLIKDGSECRMFAGTIKTVSISSPDGFARMLRTRQPSQAIAHGVSEFPEARVVTASNLAKQPASHQPAGALPIIARTKDFIKYPDGPAVLMFDHDKAREDAVAENEVALRSYKPAELIGLIATVMPEISGAAWVSTPSTSSCIYDKDGNELRGEGAGSHTYLFVENGKDIPRFLEVLGKRLTLAGYSRVETSRSGSLLHRVLVDLTVGSPERLDFVAGAVCEDGLIQKLPAPTITNGTLLNTALLPDLTPEEELQYKSIRGRMAELARPAQEAVRGQYVELEAGKLVKEQQGLDIETARMTILSRQDHVLTDSDHLYFAHMKKGQAVTVADVLNNPASYDKKPLADPLEPEYDGCSMTKARLFWNDGAPIINSFAHGQTRYTFERFEKQAVAPKVDAPKFRFISSTDLKLEVPHWLIKNHLEEKTTATMFGAPGSTKTFVAMDWGLCISTGFDWQGHKVKQAPVLYICGEGKSGIKKRITAWELHHGIKAPDFFISTSAAQLLDAGSVGEIEQAAMEVKASVGAPALLIIDTLNRNFGNGDENSTQDMSQFVQAVDYLKTQLKCAVITVHHTGLADANRGRGSSALKGAMDFEYVVEKSGDTLDEQIITLTCTKAKDFEEPPKKAFKPVLIDLGLLDEDMRPVNSLVLELTDEQPTKKSRKLSLANQLALDALKELTVVGEDASENAWRSECYSRGIATSDKPDAKQKAFARARTFLISNFYVQTRDDMYWLCRSKADPGHPDKTGQDRTCPAVSPLDRPDRQDNNLKGCPVCPAKDEDFRQKDEPEIEGAFQHFTEDAATEIPEPESMTPTEEHTRIPEMEYADLTNAVYEVDEMQEGEDAIYI